MTPPLDIEERLAEQLELPPGARGPGSDVDLAQLLEVADRIDTLWSEISPQPGAYERIYEQAFKEATKPRRRWLKLPKFILALPWTTRIAATTAVAAAVTVGVVLSGGGPAADQILARAEAAITAPGRIAHSVFTQESATSGLQSAKATYEVEQWVYTEDGLRYRVLMEDTDGRLFLDISAGTKETKTYYAATNTIGISAGTRQDRDEISLENPLGQLKEAFGKDNVKYLGETNVRGRKGYKMEADLGDTLQGSRGEYIYVVDKESYKPLYTEATVTSQFGSSITVKIYYKDFEFQSPTEENLKNLEFGNYPDAKEVDIDSLNASPQGK